jgi:hypothetical protein
MNTPERNNRNLGCPDAPQRHPQNGNNNVRINVIPFPNLDDDNDDNDGYQTPQRRYNGVVPNAPMKSNSKIDDIDRNKAYACKRRLSYNK